MLKSNKQRPDLPIVVKCTCGKGGLAGWRQRTGSACGATPLRHERVQAEATGDERHQNFDMQRAGRVASCHSLQLGVLGVVVVLLQRGRSKRLFLLADSYIF